VTLATLALAVASAWPRPAWADPVAPEGPSRVEAAFGRMQVRVDVHAKSRAVDALDIRVDGYALAVPRAAFEGADDVSTADVARREDGLVLLRLGATDATGPYTLELAFDRLALRERRVIDNATGAVRQSTTFTAPDVLD
jgi:hypothetical protein